MVYGLCPIMRALPKTAYSTGERVVERIFSSSYTRTNSMWTQCGLLGRRSRATDPVDREIGFVMPSLLG